MCEVASTLSTIINRGSTRPDVSSSVACGPSCRPRFPASAVPIRMRPARSASSVATGSTAPHSSAGAPPHQGSVARSSPAAQEPVGTAPGRVASRTASAAVTGAPSERSRAAGNPASISSARSSASACRAVPGGICSSIHPSRSDGAGSAPRPGTGSSSTVPTAAAPPASAGRGHRSHPGTRSASSSATAASTTARNGSTVRAATVRPGPGASSADEQQDGRAEQGAHPADPPPGDDQDDPGGQDGDQHATRERRRDPHERPVPRRGDRQRDRRRGQDDADPDPHDTPGTAGHRAVDDRVRRQREHRGAHQRRGERRDHHRGARGHPAQPPAPGQHRGEQQPRHGDGGAGHRRVQGDGRWGHADERDPERGGPAATAQPAQDRPQQHRAEQPAREHADLHRRPDRPRAGRHEGGDGGELAGREQVGERKRHRTDGTAARRVHGGGQARLTVGRCPRVEMQRGQDVDRRGGGHRQGRCESDACGAPTHQARHDITCAVSASPLRRAHGPVRPWQTPG